MTGLAKARLDPRSRRSAKEIWSQVGVIAISRLGDAGSYLAEAGLGADANIARPPLMRNTIASVYAVAEAVATIIKPPA